jgi:hypothetical protein
MNNDMRYNSNQRPPLVDESMVLQVQIEDRFIGCTVSRDYKPREAYDRWMTRIQGAFKSFIFETDTNIREHENHHGKIESWLIKVFGYIGLGSLVKRWIPMLSVVKDVNITYKTIINHNAVLDTVGNINEDCRRMMIILYDKDDIIQEMNGKVMGFSALLKARRDGNPSLLWELATRMIEYYDGEGHNVHLVSDKEWTTGHTVCEFCNGTGYKNEN